MIGGDLSRVFYNLANASPVYGALSVDVLNSVVTTAAEPWSYAVIVPRGDIAIGDAAEREVLRVVFSVRVETGALQFGILNRDETEFVNVEFVSARPTWQTVTLITPPLGEAGPLVIRNASEDGSSTALCRTVSVSPLQSGQAAGSASLSPEEIDFLASQLSETAGTLAPLLAADADIAMNVAPRLRDATIGLRRPLAYGGLALIERASAERVFADLPSSELRGLVSRLATPAALGPVPDWRMDAFLESADLAPFVRYAIWLAFCRRDEAEPVVLPWLGGTRIGLNFRNDLGRAIFVGGDFEPNEFALLDRVLQPGMTVLDGGANEGAYTLFFGARVGGEGRVIAVEPSPRELARLRANVALNAMDQVTVVEAALAEQTGELELRVADAGHAGQNTLGSFMYDGVGNAGSVRVPTVTIDELARSHALRGLDVVKLDLEGAELRALTGARETLRRWRPLLLLEAAPAALALQGGSFEQVLSLLDELGYRTLSFDPASGQVSAVPATAGSNNLAAVHRERDWDMPRELS